MKKLVLSVLIIFSTFTYSIQKPDHITLDVSGSYGPISGFIQIPKGGQFGSTDLERPTFKELDIDKLGLYNVSLKGTWDKSTYYISTSGNNINSNKVLEKDLLTHGIKVPKGSNMKLDTPMTFYSIGKMYEYKRYGNLIISPLAEVSMMKLNYKWTAETPDGNKIKDSRGNFHIVAPVVGLQLEYEITPSTSFIAMGKVMIPIGNRWKEYYYGSAKIVHTFFEDEVGTLNKLRGYIGIEGYYTRTKDHQSDMQNSIEVKQSPMITIGTELKF